MIKTKYVIGDVVVIDGKQEVILTVDTYTRDLYSPGLINYYLSNDNWYEESELV